MVRLPTYAPYLGSLFSSANAVLIGSATSETTFGSVLIPTYSTLGMDSDTYQYFKSIEKVVNSTYESQGWQVIPVDASKFGNRNGSIHCTTAPIY